LVLSPTKCLGWTESNIKKWEMEKKVNGKTSAKTLNSMTMKSQALKWMKKILEYIPLTIVVCTSAKVV